MRDVSLSKILTNSDNSDNSAFPRRTTNVNTDDSSRDDFLTYTI